MKIQIALTVVRPAAHQMELVKLNLEDIMRIFRNTLNGIFAAGLVILMTTISGCDFNKPDVVVIFDNKPLPNMEPEDVARMSLEELGIPYETIEPKVNEYRMVLMDLKQNMGDPDLQIKLSEIKQDIILTIVENVSLFHLRNHGMPFDVEIH